MAIFRSIFLPRALSIALIITMLGSAIWRLRNPPIQPKEEALISSGIMRIESGHYKKAYQSIRRALALNPHNAFSLELIEILKLRWIPKEASISESPVITYRRLADKYPKSPYLKILGAEVLFSEGYQKESQKLLLDTVSSDPEIPQGWFAMGSVQQAIGEINSAIFSLRRAIELDPQESYITKLGELYFMDQDWELCFENLHIVATENRLHLAAKFTYLRCLFYTGKYAEAVILSREVIEYLSLIPRLSKIWLDYINLALSNYSHEGQINLSHEQLISYVKLVETIALELNQGSLVEIEHYTSVEDESLIPVISYDLSQVRKLL